MLTVIAVAGGTPTHPPTRTHPPTHPHPHIHPPAHPHPHTPSPPARTHTLPTQAGHAKSGGADIGRFKHGVETRFAGVQSAADGACPLMEAAFGAAAASGDFYMPGELRQKTVVGMPTACMTRGQVGAACRSPAALQPCGPLSRRSSPGAPASHALRRMRFPCALPCPWTRPFRAPRMEMLRSGVSALTRRQCSSAAHAGGGLDCGEVRSRSADHGRGQPHAALGGTPSLGRDAGGGRGEGTGEGTGRGTGTGARGRGTGRGRGRRAGSGVQEGARARATPELSFPREVGAPPPLALWALLLPRHASHSSHRPSAAAPPAAPQASMSAVAPWLAPSATAPENAAPSPRLATRFLGILDASIGPERANAFVPGTEIGRVVVPVVGGSFKGPGITAEVLPTAAADWIRKRPDGVGEVGLSSRAPTRHPISRGPATSSPSSAPPSRMTSVECGRPPRPCTAVPP